MKEQSDDVFAFILEYLDECSDMGVRELAKRWYNGKEKEMTTNGDDYAFQFDAGGMTKREVYTAIALFRLLNWRGTASPLGISIQAVEIADATIVELNRKK